MKCPECNREMRWVGDERFEDNQVGDYLETVYDCKECNIDVIKKKFDVVLL